MNAHHAWPENSDTLEGILEDVRVLPDGYAELDLRTAKGELVTILLTPEALAEVFQGQVPRFALPN